MFNLTPGDAATLLAGFGVIVTIVVSWLPTLKLSDYIKFAIVALLSAIGGYLTLVATNQILSSGSLIQNGALVFAASQIFYYGAFRVLGLERVLFPQQALATQVKEQVKTITPDVTNAEAKDILDPNEKPALEITAKVI